MHQPAPQDLSHHELGREMAIYATDARVGSGLPLLLPRGAIIRGELERLAADEAQRSGCQPVHTPVLAKRELFETSGHWAKFADDMFPPMDCGGEDLVLRPSNCPHHALVYAAQPHSYRDLPVRYRELAPMFRSERSGVLTGLRRMRQINLDDTHVFARPDQVQSEVRRALDSVIRCYALLGLRVARVHLSVRDDGEGYLGSAEQWASSESQLAAACAEAGLDYEWAPGEAAFYGPKIDIEVAGAGGREETLSTVQLDLNQPERFDLRYTGPDGELARPLMIHCGVLGCMERMIAFLLEVHQGRLPPWLAPVQVALLPLGAQQHDDVDRLADQLREGGLRVSILCEGSLAARIRQARLLRCPWIGIIGPAEAASGAVSVRIPALHTQESLTAAEFAGGAAAVVAARSASAALG